MPLPQAVHRHSERALAQQSTQATRHRRGGQPRSRRHHPVLSNTLRGRSRSQQAYSYLPNLLLQQRSARDRWARPWML